MVDKLKALKKLLGSQLYSHFKSRILKDPSLLNKVYTFAIKTSRQTSGPSCK